MLDHHRVLIVVSSGLGACQTVVRENYVVPRQSTTVSNGAVPICGAVCLTNNVSRVVNFTISLGLLSKARYHTLDHIGSGVTHQNSSETILVLKTMVHLGHHRDLHALGHAGRRGREGDGPHGGHEDNLYRTGLLFCSTWRVLYT